MKVEVTEQEILAGCPFSNRECPVALAVHEATGENVSVSDCVIEVGDVKYRCPVEVASFVHRFDWGLKVEPFDFELGAPMESLPLHVLVS